jgi:diguanylate cyclase (GGDEF)-like protein
MTILYVESEDNIREKCSNFLEYFSSKLYTAKDGKDGLELYKKYKPDVIISDIDMPDMSGIDMAKAIKAMDHKQHIIFITEQSDSSNLIAAIDLQVDGYMLKPVELKKLEEKLEDIATLINFKQELQLQQELTSDIVNMQDNLLAVLNKDGQVVFSNENFLKFFGINTIDEFNYIHKQIDPLFIKHSDFFSTDTNQDWIEQIQQLSDDKRVVSMFDVSSFSPKAFLVSIKQSQTRTIVVFTDVTNMIIEKKNILAKVYFDELTNAYNRTYFNEQIVKEIARYHRYGDPFSCIILDIDHFKKLNDEYGHQVGDKVLVEISKTIRGILRITDTFARWGGEEFVIILSNTKLVGAQKVANKLRLAIQNHKFKDALKATCSFGVAEFTGSDTTKSLFKRADEALYRAKQSGRNQVQTSNTEILEEEF